MQDSDSQYKPLKRPEQNNTLSRGDIQRRRISRKEWWYEQMREVVDKEIDWQPNEMNNK